MTDRTQVNGSAAYLNALSQTGFSNDSSQPKTLYVGNLDPTITEDFILSLFQGFGRIVGLKLINDTTNNVNDPYCFIEYEDNTSAATAIMTMNKRMCLDREMKVNWATSPGNTGPKLDTSKHFHIFVGDLSPEIETQQLREAFSPFGEISDCRVVRDSHTYKSKGYGFVSFLQKEDAENAIANMNGQWLGSRAIRTNWASRKPPPAPTRNESQIGPNVSNNRHLNFDEIYSQSSPTNCTVYCGGISNGLNEDVIQKTFGRFGAIQEIRVFKDKGYAFVKFASKETATNAIVTMHNQEVLGQIMKCSWGKESIESTGMSAQTQMTQGLASPPLIYPYGQAVPYWYPQSPFGPALPPSQPYAIPAGMQYPFNQYYAPGPAQAHQQSSQAFSSPIAIPINQVWQTNSNNNPLQNLPIHPNTISSPIQSSLMGYPMQGYHAQ